METLVFLGVLLLIALMTLQAIIVHNHLDKMEQRIVKQILDRLGK